MLKPPRGFHAIMTGNVNGDITRSGPRRRDHMIAGINPAKYTQRKQFCAGMPTDGTILHLYAGNGNLARAVYKNKSHDHVLVDRHINPRLKNELPGTVRVYEKNVDKFRFVLKTKDFESWDKLPPGRVFLCDMTDLFHERMPVEFQDAIFNAIFKHDQHTYQILTKRPGIMARYITEHFPAVARNWFHDKVPKNIWLGTSVGIKKAIPRINVLRRIPASIRFLSIEPLLEDLGELDLTGIHWVIVGGESGAGWRPMNHDWARKIRDQCLEQKVPFFFKQSSAFRTEMGQELDGVRWEQYP